MFLSPRTIDGYRDELFEKLQVKSRVGLVMYSIKNRLVHIGFDFASLVILNDANSIARMWNISVFPPGNDSLFVHRKDSLCLCPHKADRIYLYQLQGPGCSGYSSCGKQG
jgi:hypothetical protein